MKVDSDIKIVEEGVIDWDEPTVITGFPGPGFVGETTAMFLIDNLRMREIGYLRSGLIPPMLVVMGPKFRPPFRIHANEEADLMVIVDNQPIPLDHHRVLSRSLMDWLDGKGVKEYVLLDGLPLPDETLEGRVVGYSSSQERLVGLGQFGVLPLTGGAITGMNAAVLEMCQERGKTWTGLLAPTRRIGAPNWRGVAAIVDVLKEMLELNVDTSSIQMREAGTVEQAIGRAKEQERRGVLSSLRRLVR